MLDGLLIETAARVDVHEVVVAKVGMGGRGAWYRVMYLGEVLIERCRDPGHDAARALLARGITGTLNTRWEGSPHVALTMGIEWAATRRTAETATVGPRTVAWTPTIRIGPRSMRIAFPANTVRPRAFCT